MTLLTGANQVTSALGKQSIRPANQSGLISIGQDLQDAQGMIFLEEDHPIDEAQREAGCDGEDAIWRGVSAHRVRNPGVSHVRRVQTVEAQRAAVHEGLDVPPTILHTSPPCSGQGVGKPRREAGRTLCLVCAIASALLAGLSACTGRLDVQCQQDSNCNLGTGGVCATAATGRHWCAYPDTGCPGGYRYSDQQIGDSLSGACVAVGADAGIIGPTGQPAQSCVALPYTCGADGNDNCCNSLEVPAGTYFRSYDLANDASSGDRSSRATISGFRLDKYEVTVGRFRAFVAAGGGTRAHPPAVGAGMHPDLPGSGWEASWNPSLVPDTASLMAALKGGASAPACNTRQTWIDAPGARENWPMNCITWYEAMAFCAWDGGFLPTEAEWNYAAAGGDEQRAYPWSNPASSLTIDVSHASYSCRGPGCNVIAAVGTKPAGDGRWGQSDLAGNVFEWTLDWWGPYPNSCTDCANLTSGAYRTSRGGSYDDVTTPADGLRTGYRNLLDPPEVRSQRSGVRCARGP